MFVATTGVPQAMDSSSTLAQQSVLSRLRRGPQVGFMTDAFALEAFVRAVLAGMQSGETISSSAGTISFTATAQLAALGLNEQSEVRYLTAEQSNSSVVIGGG